MDQRQKNLEALLKEHCDTVYFHPPTNVKLVYPCIIYDWVGGIKEAADNIGYKYTRQWSVLHITKSPIDDTPMQMLQTIAMSEFNRTYSVNGLIHTVINIYY